MIVCDGVCTFLGLSGSAWYAAVTTLVAIVVAGYLHAAEEYEEPVLPAALGILIGLVWPAAAAAAVLYGAFWLFGTFAGLLWKLFLGRRA